MADNKKKISYFNTLIFTILAALFSLLLLVLLFFKGFKQYLPFIIVLELGIFIIILICITQIILNERNSALLKNDIAFKLDFTSCPDYFIKRNDGNNELCSNEYIYTDEKNIKYIMKIYPQDRQYGLPPLHSNSYNIGDPKLEKFPLNEISLEKSVPTYNDKCALFTSDPKDKKLMSLNINGYSLIPWTNIKSKCSSAN